LTIAGNQSLFSIIGTRFGGNGKTTFALPNFMGRTPLCISFDGTVEVGAAGGAKDIQLIEENLPEHNHTAPTNYRLYQRATTEEGDLQVPNEGSYPATLAGTLPTDIAIYGDKDTQQDSTLAPIAVAADANLPVFNTGQGKKTSNMQPYIGMAYYIALEGLFPARA